MTPFYIYQVGCPYDSKFKWAHFYSSWFSNFIWNRHRSGYWGRVSEILRFLHRCLTRGCSQEQYLWGVRKAGLGKGRRWGRMQLLRGLRWSYTSFGAGMLLQSCSKLRQRVWALLDAGCPQGGMTLDKVLQLRTIPQGELSCEPSAATSEFLDPREMCWAHNIHCMPIMWDCIILS